MENRLFDITVGQEVFLKPTGNNRIRWDGKPLRGSVEKIARKYFYVRIDSRPHYEDRFDRETFEYDEQDRNGGYIVFESLNEFYKEAEYIMMLHSIKEYFSSHLASAYGEKTLSYDAVKKIYSLLEQEGVIRPDRSEYSGC